MQLARGQALIPIYVGLPGRRLPDTLAISVDALLGSVGSVSCLVAYSLPLGNPRVLPQHGSSTMEIPRSRRRYRNLRGALLHGRITHLVQLV